MNVVTITDLFERAKDRLLEQYKDKPNIVAILDIYTEEFQELENSADGLYDRMNIAFQVGQQLDEIGDIVGEPRNGNTDERYRILLYAKIGINTSEGTAEDIISVAKLIAAVSYVHFINLGRRQITLEIPREIATTQDEVNFLFQQLQRSVAGGVRLENIHCHHETLAFGFDGDDNNPEFKGFDDGCFADILRPALPFAFDDPEDPLTAGFGAGSDDPIIGGEFIV